MQSEIHAKDMKNVSVRSKMRKASAYHKKVHAIRASKVYIYPESALSIASDTRYQNTILKKVAHLCDAEHIILVGIGGSSLGASAVYEALKQHTTKQLHIIDAIEETAYTEIIHLFSRLKKIDSVACVVVSKSGNTAETLINAGVVIDHGVKRFGNDFLKRVVYIGGEQSPLIVRANKENVLVITHPDIIGGRFSVFSAVSIVPLYLLGLDVKAFCSGAKSAFEESALRDSCTRTAVLGNAVEKGIHTLDFFVFSESLKILGSWYRQLVAESIGKPHTKHKKPFTHQLLPTVSSSIDLHSMAQLYLGGYTGIFTYFVSVQEESTTTPASSQQWLYKNTEMLQGKTPSDVKRAIQSGVVRAYQDAKLSYTAISLESLSPYELGTFMATAMLEVMTLAHLFDVDAFNQPQVELYKTHTRTLLSNT